MSRDRHELVTLGDIVSSVNAILRILATAAIFVYHSTSRFGYESEALLPTAFAGFLFLSGFYALLDDGQRPPAWIKRRLQRIYLPYWLTIAGVLFANVFFQYKPVDWTVVLSLALGMNWFHPHPLYVVTWYVTLIIYLYLSVFIFYLASNAFLKALVAVLMSYALLALGAPVYFLISFTSGLTLAWLLRSSGLSQRPVRPYFVPSSSVRRALRQMQNHTYEFFLLHGGIILFYQMVLKWPFYPTFWSSLATTALLSILLRQTTALLANRVLGWTDNALSRPSTP